MGSEILNLWGMRRGQINFGSSQFAFSEFVGGKNSTNDGKIEQWVRVYDEASNISLPFQTIHRGDLAGRFTTMNDQIPDQEIKNEGEVICIEAIEH
jgi:hypothetical protein